MAFGFYNRGLYKLINTAVSGSTDVRALVVAGASLPSGAKDPDLNTVSELLAVSGVTEAAASGYGRADLASFAVTENDTNDRVDISAAAPTMTSVAVGETWRMIVYYIEGANDAARELIGYDEPASTLVTNSGNVTLPALTVTVID